MIKYIFKRILTLIPVLLCVSIVAFMMVHMLPGDPARVIAGESATNEDVELIRKAYGFDKPLPEQYLNYMNKLFHGDLGQSYVTKRPIADDIAVRYPKTFQLAGIAMIIAVIFGVVIGIISATNRNSIIDNVAMLLALAGLSLPTFYLGLMLILIVCVKLQWLPISGGTGLLGTILPAFTINLRSIAIIARMTRSSMLEVLSQDYIMAAKAQGFNKRQITYKHALKNAMTSVLTVTGLQFGAMMGGAVVVETVFTWPGLGTYLINAIKGRDFPVIQSTVLVIAATYVLVNLLVDLSYALVNPKIRY